MLCTRVVAGKFKAKIHRVLPKLCDDWFICRNTDRFSFVALTKAQNVKSALLGLVRVMRAQRPA